MRDSQSISSCKSLKAVPLNSCSIGCKMSPLSKPGLQWAAVAGGGQLATKVVTQMEPTVWATVGDRQLPASHILNKHLTIAFFFENLDFMGHNSYHRLPPKLAQISANQQHEITLIGPILLSEVNWGGVITCLKKYIISLFKWHILRSVKASTQSALTRKVN